MPPLPPMLRSLRPERASAPATPPAPAANLSWLEEWLGATLPPAEASAVRPTGPLRVGRFTIQADRGFLAAAVEVRPGLYLLGEVPDYDDGAGLRRSGRPGADLGIITGIANAAVSVVGTLGDWIGGFMPRHQENLLEQRAESERLDALAMERQLQLAAEQAELEQRLAMQEQRDQLKLAKLMAANMSGGIRVNRGGIRVKRATLEAAEAPEVASAAAVASMGVDLSPGLPGRAPRLRAPVSGGACCQACAVGRACDGV